MRMDTEPTTNMPTGGAGPEDTEISEEELQQLKRERDERLDPQNRPANAEIDNTTRDWVQEKEDFQDNLDGNPPEFDKGDGAGKERDPEIWERIHDQND
jgi:hypothetical protein